MASSGSSLASFGESRDDVRADAGLGRSDRVVCLVLPVDPEQVRVLAGDPHDVRARVGDDLVVRVRQSAREVFDAARVVELRDDLEHCFQ